MSIVAVAPGRQTQIGSTMFQHFAIRVGEFNSNIFVDSAKWSALSDERRNEAIKVIRDKIATSIEQTIDQLQVDMTRDMATEVDRPEAAPERSGPTE